MKLGKIEKIMCFLFVAGLVMKLLFLPLAGIILTLSLSSLAVIYYLSVTKNRLITSELFFSTEEASQINGAGQFGMRLSGWGLSILVVGILFCIQFWPNARFFLVLGLGSIIVGFFAINTGVKKSLPLVFTRVTQRLFIFGAIALILYSTPSIELFAVFHRDNPEYVAAVRESWANPRDKELKKKAEELRNMGKSKE